MVDLLDALTLFPAVRRLIWAANSSDILDGSCSYCKRTGPLHSNRLRKY